MPRAWEPAMKKLGLSLAFLLLAMSVPAMATILDGTETGGTARDAGGVFVKLTLPFFNPFGPPNAVGNDTFQSPNLYGFDEDQNILLAAPLQIDVGAGPIASGTTIASHYVFFDPGPSQHVIGVVNFDSDILGIITSTGFLAASDFLANTGVTYLSPSARGLEAGDSVTISGTRQILFDTFASSPGDYVRVLTAFSPLAAAVPEPASALLLALGLVALAWRLRGRTANASPR
jgi:hypothetical protein